MLGVMGFEETSKALLNSRPSPIQEFRDEFPVTRQLIYLNHAAVAPLSRRASKAMKDLTEQACQFGSLHYTEWMKCYNDLRHAAARLINAGNNEIAIVKNTSEGISFIAEGFPWKAGDQIVAFREEFPANYYPWLRLEARGVKLKWLSIYDSLETIAAALPGTRLLAISFVNYLSGYRVDLRAIGELCREHGSFFFVDAIQGMGVYPLDVEECAIDALAADGHKWMLGPEGNGILYVRKKWQDTIEPTEFGWTNPAHYFDYGKRDMTLRPDAGRYECGTLNTVGCYGLRAALDLIVEVGVQNICNAVDSLAQQVEDGVRNLGYELLVRRTPMTGSGIVSFRHPAIDSSAIVSSLKRDNILATPRQEWIRVSPHFYITPDEIDRVIAGLPPI
ncbi:MAG: aminotransferase class V-fold PLP-dependent enzyme [Bryobacteraceae bacterium]